MNFNRETSKSENVCFCLKRFSPYLNFANQILFFIWKKIMVLFTSTCNCIYSSVFKIREIQNMSFS